jgi:hypothetical protein
MPYAPSTWAKDFKSNAHIAHILGKSILPTIFSILLVDVNHMLDRGGGFNAIFMPRFTNSEVHGQNNDISLPQNIRDPPHKGRLLPYAASCNKSGNLHRIRFFQNLQFNPLVRAIGPLDYKYQALSHLTHTLGPSLCDELLIDHLSSLP